MSSIILPSAPILSSSNNNGNSIQLGSPVAAAVPATVLGLRSSTDNPSPFLFPTPNPRVQSAPAICNQQLVPESSRSSSPVQPAVVNTEPSSTHYTIVTDILNHYRRLTHPPYAASWGNIGVSTDTYSLFGLSPDFLFQGFRSAVILSRWDITDFCFTEINTIVHEAVDKRKWTNTSKKDNYGKGPERKTVAANFFNYFRDNILIVLMPTLPIGKIKQIMDEWLSVAKKPSITESECIDQYGRGMLIVRLIMKCRLTAIPYNCTFTWDPRIIKDEEQKEHVVGSYEFVDLKEYSKLIKDSYVNDEKFQISYKFPMLAGINEQYQPWSDCQYLYQEMPHHYREDYRQFMIMLSTNNFKAVIPALKLMYKQEEIARELAKIFIRVDGKVISIAEHFNTNIIIPMIAREKGKETVSDNKNRTRLLFRKSGKSKRDLQEEDLRESKKVKYGKILTREKKLNDKDENKDKILHVHSRSELAIQCYNQLYQMSKSEMDEWTEQQTLTEGFLEPKNYVKKYLKSINRQLQDCGSHLQIDSLYDIIPYLCPIIAVVKPIGEFIRTDVHIDELLWRKLYDQLLKELSFLDNNPSACSLFIKIMDAYYNLYQEYKFKTQTMSRTITTYPGVDVQRNKYTMFTLACTLVNYVAVLKKRPQSNQEITVMERDIALYETNLSDQAGIYTNLKEHCLLNENDLRNQILNNNDLFNKNAILFREGWKSELEKEFREARIQFNLKHKVRKPISHKPKSCSNCFISTHYLTLLLDYYYCFECYQSLFTSSKEFDRVMLDTVVNHPDIEVEECVQVPFRSDIHEEEVKEEKEEEDQEENKEYNGEDDDEEEEEQKEEQKENFILCPSPRLFPLSPSSRPVSPLSYFHRAPSFNFDYSSFPPIPSPPTSPYSGPVSASFDFDYPILSLPPHPDCYQQNGYQVNNE